MKDSERYPNGVTKLGVLQRESQWIDAQDRVWRWDDWYGWCYSASGEWHGSFQTVEGDPPYRAVDDA